MIVLHAGALLCAALAEPRSEWVVTQVVHDDVAAPSHQPTWVLESLLTLARGGLLTDEELHDGVSAVLTLPQELHTPDTGLMRRAQQLAGVVPFLDALHVALAERLRAPLVTSDGVTPGGTGWGAVQDVVTCEVRSPPAWLFPDG